MSSFDYAKSNVHNAKLFEKRGVAALENSKDPDEPWAERVESDLAATKLALDSQTYWTLAIRELLSP